MIQEEAVHIFFVGTLTTSGVTSDWRVDPNNIFKSWIIIRWNIVAVLNNIRLTGTESRNNIVIITMGQNKRKKVQTRRSIKFKDDSWDRETLADCSIYNEIT